MNKFLIFTFIACAAACAVSTAQAQPLNFLSFLDFSSPQGQNGATAPATPELVEEAVAQAEFVRVVLASSLAAANLPPAFAERSNKVLTDADAALDTCEEQVRTTGVLWVYKVCTTAVLKSSRYQLKQLQKEAAAATSTATPAVAA